MSNGEPRSHLHPLLWDSLFFKGKNANVFSLGSLRDYAVLCLFALIVIAGGCLQSNNLWSSAK